MSDGAGAGRGGPERRWWTLDAAQAYLPSLDRLFDSLERAVQDGSRVDHPVLYHGVLSVLAEDGVEVRDLARRLVDFPARAGDGSTILLCRVGDEAVIEWWHREQDGFAGRRSLHQDPPW